MQDDKPTVVLICHEQDRLDTEGLASWLASTMDWLVSSSFVIRAAGSGARRDAKSGASAGCGSLTSWRSASFARLRLARRDRSVEGRRAARLRRRYPADLDVGAAHRRLVAELRRGARHFSSGCGPTSRSRAARSF